jgi:zinc transporter, ZIP family
MGQYSLTGAALGSGSLAAASLVLGAGLAFARHWPPSQVGLVLAFGAGALISAVSFELTEEAIAIGDAAVVGLGLALGAVAYYVADGVIDSGTTSGRGKPGRKEGPAPAPHSRWAPSSTACRSSLCSGSGSRQATG